MRRAAILVQAILTGSVACGGPEPAELTGDHTRQHLVYVFHGSEPVEVQVEDRLTLQTLGRSDVRFALRLRAGAGKGCEISGVAKARRGGFEYRETLPSGRCRLRIRKLNGRITAEDVDDSCREHYCAEGVSIGRLTFAEAE